MRRLFFLVIIVIAGWSGYWWVGATAHKRALDDWLVARQNDGWLAERDALTVAGYPGRFDTTVTNLAIADPRSGWAWTADAFQILMLSYKPNHVIVVWPGTQTVASPWDRAEVTSKTMRGSVVFRPTTSLELDRSVIEIEDLKLVSNTGWTAGLSHAQLSTRQAEPGTAPGFAHDISFNARDLTLPDTLRRLLERSEVLPTVFDSADIDLTASFDGPWDRHAIEGQKPRLTAASIRRFDAEWGEMALKARGRFTIGPEGYPEGQIDITARNWREMLRLAVDGHLLPGAIADDIEAVMAVAAQLTGDGKTITMPMYLSGGYVRIGPVPVARAWRF